MSAKHAINDKLQSSVATYLRCGGVVNNQIIFFRWVCQWIFLKSVHISQSYKQERDCLVHFKRLLAVCWQSALSAWDNHALACNFATPFSIFFNSETHQ